MAVNITLVGNISNDPELRFTPDGRAVANFNVANSTRQLDKTTNQWKDVNTTYYKVTVWRDQAQNVSDSLKKGQRVVVVGKLSQSEYKTQDGSVRYNLDVTADDVAPSLLWAKTSVEKVTKTNNAPSETTQSSNASSDTTNTTNTNTNANTENNGDNEDADPWATATDPDF